MNTRLKPDTLTLRYAECPSLGIEIERWEPADPRLVDLELELNIGWSDWESGDENIFFLRVTSNDLRKRSRQKDQRTLWFDEFRWFSVREEILDRIARCERGTWKESFAQLRECFRWYYEGSSWHGY